MLKAIRRMNAKLLTFFWERWLEVLDDIRRLKEAARKVVQRWNNVQYLGAFSTWFHWWDVKKRAQAMLQNVVGTLKQNCFMAWKEMTDETLAERRGERARLEALWQGIHRDLDIAKALHAGQVLHVDEQRCYACLLTMKWDKDDMLLTVADRRAGQVFVGFDADDVDKVDWGALTARAAEKQRLRPQVFAKLADDLRKQAAHFLKNEKAQRDEFYTDVAAVLRHIYSCDRQVALLSANCSGALRAWGGSELEGELRAQPWVCLRPRLALAADSAIASDGSADNTSPQHPTLQSSTLFVNARATLLK